MFSFGLGLGLRMELVGRLEGFRLDFAVLTCLQHHPINLAIHKSATMRSIMLINNLGRLLGRCCDFMNTTTTLTHQSSTTPSHMSFNGGIDRNVDERVSLPPSLNLANRRADH